GDVTDERGVRLMAKARSRPTKFALELRKIRTALAKAEASAAKGIAHGTRKIADPRASTNLVTLAANKSNLARAKKAQRNLQKSIQLLSEACCDPFFDCDPEF